MILLPSLRLAVTGWIACIPPNLLGGSSTTLVEILVSTGEVVTLAQNLVTIRDLDSDKEVEDEEDSKDRDKYGANLPHGIFHAIVYEWNVFVFFHLFIKNLENQVNIDCPEGVTDDDDIVEVTSQAAGVLLLLRDGPTPTRAVVSSHGATSAWRK